jgi:A/G-specific adenine glycosylase
MTTAGRTSAHTQPDAPVRGAAPTGNPGIEPEQAARVRQDLLEWYGKQRRSLPWRATRDPYCIWVSEVMLQQTQVATVIGFYERWMRRFPDVAALAGADTEDVLRAWEGLGYYSRARNLQRAARDVVAHHGGRLPPSVAALLSLPGIGRYSAGAIASIAFGADEPAIDGNIVRVLTRLFALGGDPKRAPLAARLWELARALLPTGRAGDFNQALMELGATICTPKAPRCVSCPIQRHCAALRADRVLDYPESAPRRAPTLERRAVAWITKGLRVLAVRAPQGAARWAGMWQFPDVELGGTRAPHAALASGLERSTGLSVQVGERLLELRHQVTRFRIELEVFGCTAPAGRARALAYDEVRWTPVDELGTLPMPAAHRKIARSLAST